jgi:hypothetical protein
MGVSASRRRVRRGLRRRAEWDNTDLVLFLNEASIYTILLQNANLFFLYSLHSNTRG